MNETFRAPRNLFYQGVFFFALFAPIAVGVLVGFPLTCPPENRWWAFWLLALPMGLMFCAFAWYGLHLAGLAWNGSVQLDDKGITRQSFRARQSVAWPEITEVQWSAIANSARLTSPHAKVSLEFELIPRDRQLEVIRRLRAETPAHAAQPGWPKYCLRHAWPLLSADDPPRPGDVLVTRKRMDRTFAIILVAFVPLCAAAGWFMYESYPENKLPHAFGALGPLVLIAVFWIVLRRAIPRQGQLQRKPQGPRPSGLYLVVVLVVVEATFLGAMLTLLAWLPVPQERWIDDGQAVWWILLVLGSIACWPLGRHELRIAQERIRWATAQWEQRQRGESHT